MQETLQMDYNIDIKFNPTNRGLSPGIEDCPREDELEEANQTRPPSTKSSHPYKKNSSFPNE